MSGNKQEAIVGNDGKEFQSCQNCSNFLGNLCGTELKLLVLQIEVESLMDLTG